VLTRTYSWNTYW